MDIRQLILPAGVGLTHIEVYAEPGPDGVVGGGAHIHMVCSEIYYVLKGQGQIECLSFDGLDVIDLIPNKAVIFRPGVIHRVLNPDRNMEILAIMQNGGLPERGDYVMTFPAETMANTAAYTQAIRVTDYKDAIRRRDLSIEGYRVIREAMLQDKAKGRELLGAFYRHARNLIAPKVDGFEWVLTSGAQTEAKASADACDFLRAGRTDYLERAKHAAIYPLNDPQKMGMSGQLHPYALDESWLAEGKKVA